MFPKRISLKLFEAYVLLTLAIINGRDCFKDLNKKEKTDFDLKLSPAINFITESVNSSNIWVIGCNSSFQNDFNKITAQWRTNASLTLLNVEKKYGTKMKFPKNDFILLLVDQHFNRYLPEFMSNVMGRIRKHKMLVILKTVDCDSNGFLIELSAFLWSNKILNFIILRDCGNSTRDVYSYLPFANGNCREFTDTNIVKLGTFSINMTEKISFQMEYIVNANNMDTSTRHYLPFFPNKIPLKLNNCEVIVSTGIWPPHVVDVNVTDRGIEMDFVFMALEHMNASITVVVDPNSWTGLAQGEEEEHTGRLARLKNESFDLMVFVPAHHNVFRDFDTTESYLPNKLEFVVPTAAVFPSSMILWSMLEKQSIFLLLIVGVVLILSVIVNVLIQATWKMRLNTQPRIPRINFIKNIVTTFLVFLRSLIETSTPTMPEIRTIQWIYGMWFAACLIISCYFNTTLTSFFTEPGRLKQLETIPDIIESNINIAMNDVYYQFIIADPVLQNYISSKNTNCSVMIGLKLTAMGVAATFTSDIRAEYISAQWLSSSGEKSIRLIEEGNLRYWNNLALYRGNVFTERINDLVKRATTSGYWEHQKKKYYYRRLIRVMIRQYLMVHNYHRGISNARLISELNSELLDTIDSVSKKVTDQSEKFALETNEQDIIDRFVRTDKTLITWETLSPVFRLCAIGLTTAGVIFLLEHMIYYLS